MVFRENARGDDVHKLFISASSFIFVFVLSLSSCFAQEVGAVSESPQTESALERILGFNERSKTFSNKRNERSQIIRSIEMSKSEAAEINNRIAKIDEEQSKSQQMPLRSRTSDDLLLDLNEKIRKAQYDLKNIKIEMARYKSQMETELASLLKDEGNGVLSAEASEQKRRLEVRIQSIPQESEMQIQKAQFELDNLEARKKEFSEFQQKEQEYFNDLAKVDNDRKMSLLKEREGLVKKGLDLKNSIRILEDKQDNVNNEISDLIDVGDAESAFRLSISTMFAFLVFVVIIGFFLIIRKKDDVVFEIFSKDSGIQFITLFSIVIAIILFGITGVLEGKELAALLAGLSGYILGRGSGIQSAVHSKTTEAPHPPAPASA